MFWATAHAKHRDVARGRLSVDMRPATNVHVSDEFRHLANVAMRYAARYPRAGIKYGTEEQEER